MVKKKCGGQKITNMHKLIVHNKIYNMHLKTNRVNFVEIGRIFYWNRKHQRDPFLKLNRQNIRHAIILDMPKFNQVNVYN